MKLLIFWDVFGRVWREWLKKELPGLVKKYTTLAKTNDMPEIKKKRSHVQKKTQNRPDVKEKNSQGVKDYWKKSELILWLQVIIYLIILIR